MEEKIITSKRIDPIGPVETTASRVVQNIRKKTGITLDKRVGFHEFKKTIEPLMKKEASTYPGNIKKPLLAYLERILLKPREYERIEDRAIIENMASYQWTGKNIEEMARCASMLFDVIINMIESGASSSFYEAKEALWKQYLNANLTTFGSHAIYNKAIDTIEKVSKRHLPRKMELKTPEEKIVKKKKEALAN